ncbi:MAG: hypothetical protein AAF499_10955 [Pseudomonadota bacterium]
MGRLFAIGFAAVLMAGVPSAQALGLSGTQLRYGFEIAAIDTDGLPSWVDGSVGKFATNGAERPFRGYAEHAKQLSDTVSTKLVIEATADEIGDPINATEAYVRWRPVPRSDTRYRIKFGAFYPGVSLENTQPGWRSPYTVNYSAINTWVAEELRTTGVELTAIKKLPELGANHRLILQAAAFGWNDPAGTILSWRGWALHDRQTRFGDNLPLPPLPLNRPGEMFQTQAAVIEPLKEVDDRVGFYTAAEWNVRGRFLIKGLYYDNRGDPEALVNGQYGWDTRFGSLGVKLAFPHQTTLLAQWMQGNTGMGPMMSGKHVIDNDFESYYLLLSRRMGKHRLTMRYDRFRVDDVDVITADDNNEKGNAWTLSYRYPLSKRLLASTEWTRVETTRPNFAFNGFATRQIERQFEIRLRYTL